MASRKEYELAVRIVGLVDASLGQAGAHTKKQMRDIARAAASVSQETVTFQEAMENAGPGIDNAWKGITKTVKTGAVAIAAAAAAALAAGKAATDVGSDFEHAMSNWKGTADATQEEYELAREAALEMGRSTTKTAKESANALEYMALAGWSVKDSVAALPGVLHLAEATGLDLAETSDLVTDSMSATGEVIGENGEELQRFLDVAAKANNKSNQTAQQLMTAWIKTGGIFANLNVDITDSATALGILANRGIKAEEAGTKLKALMVNLTTGGGEAGKMMKKLGLSAFDAEGKFIGLKPMLMQVYNATKDLTEEERNAAFAALGGKRHVDGLNDLMQGLSTTVENGKTEWDNLNDELKNANGALEKMAETKMDNLWGDLKILESATQDLGIKLYDGFRDPLRDITQEMTRLVYKSGDMTEALEDMYPTAKRLFKEGAADVKNMAEPLIKLGEAIVSNPEALSGLLGSVTFLVSSITALKGVKAVNDSLFGKSGFITMIMAMGSNPATAAVGALAAIAGGVIGVSTALSVYNKRMASKNLNKHFGELTLNLSALDSIAREIVGSNSLERLSEAMKQLDVVEEVKDKIKSANETLDKLDWKIKAGITLSETDLADYQTAINTLLENGQKYIDEKKYSITLSVKALFPEGDTRGDTLQASLTTYLEQVQDEMQGIAKQIGIKLGDAVKDGMISPTEQEGIDELRAKYQQLLNEMEGYKNQAKLKRLAGKYQYQELTPETFKNLMSETGDYLAEAEVNASANEENLLTTLMAKYKGGEGDMSQEDFEASQAQIHEGYLETVGTSRSNAMSVATETINKNYQEEIEKAYADFQETIKGYDPNMEGTAALQIFNGDGLTTDKHTKDALSSLWKQMKPNYDKLREIADEYRNAGKEVPQAVADGIAEASKIGALTGDKDALSEMLGDKVKKDAEFQKMMYKWEEKGGAFPKAVARGIQENSNKVRQQLDELRNNIENYSKLKYGLPVDIYLILNKPVIPSPQELLRTPPDRLGNMLGGKKQKGYALGGFVTEPTNALIGEGGDTEVVIPINRSSRSRNLFREAGRQLQAAGADVYHSNTSKVNFAPVINIAGNADRNEVYKGVQMAMPEFARMVEQYEKDKRRTAF